MDYDAMRATEHVKCNEQIERLTAELAERDALIAKCVRQANVEAQREVLEKLKKEAKPVTVTPEIKERVRGSLPFHTQIGRDLIGVPVCRCGRTWPCPYSVKMWEGE